MSLTVAELLRQSRVEHDAYHHADAVNMSPGRWENGDRAVALAALGRARDLRVQADGLDPSHADSAWKLDRAAHADILAFYNQVLNT